MVRKSRISECVWWLASIKEYIVVIILTTIIVGLKFNEVTRLPCMNTSFSCNKNTPPETHQEWSGW